MKTFRAINMNEENAEVLILSVNDEGVISLWDNTSYRLHGASDERDVDLFLTQEQVTKLLGIRR